MKNIIPIVILTVCLGMAGCGGGPELTGFFSDGSVSVTSVPSGAAIYVDEGTNKPYDGSAFHKKTRYGNTPRTMSLTKGDHMIRLKKDGYKDHTEWVHVEAGSVKEIHIVLEPVGSPAKKDK